jgi:hypothetical protein
MTYDQPNEALRFVWRKESFVFAVLAASASETKRTVARWAMELAGLGGSSCREALEVGAKSQALRLKERCAASRLEGRSEATNTFVAAQERSLRQAQGSLSRPPAAPQNEVGELHGAKKVALKRT